MLTLVFDYGVGALCQLVAMTIDDLYCRHVYKDKWSWFSVSDFKECWKAYSDNVDAMIQAVIDAFPRKDS